MNIAAILLAAMTVAGVSREAETKARWSWEGRHAKFMEQIESGSRQYDIVFVGDSITDLMQAKRRGNLQVFTETYGEMSTLNLGISGDRIENVVWRLENGELDGYQAKVFRILLGTNNIPKRWKADQIADGIAQIVETVKAKHPESKIEILSILPRNDRKCPKDGMERIRAANELVAKLSDGEKVVFVDVFNLFMGPDGEVNGALFVDGLHPNPEGYRLLFAVEKQIQEGLMK